ncbi:MAG TPA: glycosyltransferase family 4 protein [Gaiellaceae bacterium]|nr:glycosyltransferase family 4 protein [Gaiellaceae bacterium]
MRILLWHGYLLSGTGSNVYTQSIARAWSRAGHDVTVFCQEPDADRFDLAGAAVVKPDLPDRLLPVFVVDRYEGLEPRLLQDFTADELDRYVTANAAALFDHLPADVVFCNHVLPGGAVGAASGARFAVKAHGSELEYSIRGRHDLAERARAALAPAGAVFVGSAHIRTVLEDVVGPLERVLEVPPGVDVEEFVPQPREEALRDLLDECRRDPANPGNANERLPDECNAARLERFLEGNKPTVLYFGKLLYNKGVHLLLEALHGLDARALIVGFGDYRQRLEQLAPQRTLFTGQLEHRHLVHLIPLADAVVVPSIFPEAFGMVAAEAAAAGCPPIVARHSGLAEVAQGLEAAYPERHRELASFDQGDSVELQEKLHDLLSLPAEERRSLGAAARAVAVEQWSWESVAQRLLEPFV